MKKYARITEEKAAHLTIGELHDLLSVMPEKGERGQELTCYFDFASIQVAKKIGSYRGYYEDLALGYQVGGAAVTISELKALLANAMNSTFTGYKGGEFDMNSGTRIWAENCGDCGGQAIVGAECDGFSVTILTEKMEY